MADEESADCAALLEQAHLALIRRQFPQARRLLNTALIADPGNPDAARMLSQLDDDGVSGKVTLVQWLGVDTWTTANFLAAAFACTCLGVYFGIGPLQAGLSHGFGLTTLFFVRLRNGGGFNVPIWLLLLVALALLAAGVCSLLYLVYKSVRDFRR